MPGYVTTIAEQGTLLHRVCQPTMFMEFDPEKYLTILILYRITLSIQNDESRVSKGDQ